MADPIRVESLDHVTIVVADLERSRQFYVDVLGMREVERPAFSFRGKWFQAGATQVHLILSTEQIGPPGPGTPEDRRTSRSNHFAFSVPDARRAAERLAERGVPVLGEPKPRPDGATQVFALDPDGYVVELCSAPKRPEIR